MNANMNTNININSNMNIKVSNFWTLGRLKAAKAIFSNIAMPGEPGVQELGEPPAGCGGTAGPRHLTISLPDCKNPKASLVGEQPVRKSMAPAFVMAKVNFAALAGHATAAD